MSRYPGNPKWCQEHDYPIEIERADWEEAEEAGWITLEHVLVRVQRIFQHVYGTHQGDSAAYDADGFMTALTAEGLRGEGVVLQVYSNDHWPPHAHVLVPGVKTKLTINLETFTIDQPLPDGWSKRGRKIEKFALENAQQLLRTWERHHGMGPLSADSADSSRTPDEKPQISG